MADDPKGPSLDRVREALRRHDEEADAGPPEPQDREDEGGESEEPPS
jgi:hypothetical protein